MIILETEFFHPRFRIQGRKYSGSASKNLRIFQSRNYFQALGNTVWSEFLATFVSTLVTSTLGAGEVAARALLIQAVTEVQLTMKQDALWIVECRLGVLENVEFLGELLFLSPGCGGIKVGHKIAVVPVIFKLASAGSPGVAFRPSGRLRLLRHF